MRKAYPKVNSVFQWILEGGGVVSRKSEASRLSSIVEI